MWTRDRVWRPREGWGAPSRRVGGRAQTQAQEGSRCWVEGQGVRRVPGTGSRNVFPGAGGWVVPPCSPFLREEVTGFQRGPSPAPTHTARTGWAPAALEAGAGGGLGSRLSPASNGHSLPGSPAPRPWAGLRGSHELQELSPRPTVRFRKTNHPLEPLGFSYGSRSPCPSGLRQGWGSHPPGAGPLLGGSPARRRGGGPGPASPQPGQGEWRCPPRGPGCVGRASLRSWC